MPLFRLPACVATAFLDLAQWLDRRSAVRLPLLLYGLLFAKGRRTVTSWFRAAGITDEFRHGYTIVCAVGRQAGPMALSTWSTVQPLLDSGRLTVAIDDTPTPRYGPQVEGCGRHHNPSRGPAGEKWQDRSGPQTVQFYVTFAERMPHRLTCQPLGRERLGSDQPGSRRIPGRGPPSVPKREETVPVGFPPAGKIPGGNFATRFRHSTGQHERK